MTNRNRRDTILTYTSLGLLAIALTYTSCAGAQHHPTPSVHTQRNGTP